MQRTSTGQRGPSAVAPKALRSHSLADAGGFAVMAMIMVFFLIPAALWVLHAPPGMAEARVEKVPTELSMLALAALLALVLPVMQIVMHIRAFGGPAIRSNRDDYPEAKGALARVPRAHANLIESLTPFAAVVLAAHSLGISDRVTVAASVVYAAARFVHAVTYVLGITVLRSSAFYAGLVATAVIGARLF